MPEVKVMEPLAESCGAPCLASSSGPIEFAVDHPLRRLQVDRRQQFIGAFDIGRGADDVIEPADPREQVGDLIFPGDVSHDGAQTGRVPQRLARPLQLCLRCVRQ